ncbi:MAG: SLC13 family permease [Rhizobiaceae bacterium]
MDQFHIWATYLIIAITIIAYASERFSLELVALSSLASILALFALFPFTSGDTTIAPDDLLMGFASPALATVLALLIVGQGLFATDAMDGVVKVISRIGGSSGFMAIAITLIVAGALSAVLNNTPVVVIFIPIVSLLAAQRNLSPASSLLPLSYISILGGMTTLIGSSTNLLAAGVAGDAGVKIGFFDITVPGLILAAVGAIYVFAVVPLLFRSRDISRNKSGTSSGAQFIGEIRLGSEHPFIGMESNAGLFPQLRELMPRLILRGKQAIYPPFEDTVLSHGDKLVITATRQAFMRALAGGSASPASGQDDDDASATGPTVGYQVAETVVAPGSRHSGRTIRNAGIETSYGVEVIAILRKSRMNRIPFPEIRLEPGDTVLVGGSETQLQNLRANHDLLLLEWSAETVPQRRRAGIALTIFAAIVICAASGVIPIASAAIVGAFAMIATGCLTLQQAARAFDRQVFILVGASIAAAIALERTGGAMLLAEAVVNLLEDYGSVVLLSGFFAFIALMTNFLSNNAAAVLFTPVGIGIAKATGAPPEAFVAAVIFAANASFATPMGYQTNLMVMGPGNYRFLDFVKAGIPLVIIIWLTFSIVGPWYYGL